MIVSDQVVRRTATEGTQYAMGGRESDRHCIVRLKVKHCRSGYVIVQADPSFGYGAIGGVGNSTMGVCDYGTNSGNPVRTGVRLGIGALSLTLVVVAGAEVVAGRARKG